MDTNYTYVKSRREFGKQCRFSYFGPKVMYDVWPDPSDEKQWLLRNPIDKTTQEGIMWSEHEINTDPVEYSDRGMCHNEGGWPKEINLDDPDQVIRFRKKAEKEESYLQAALDMSNVAEHLIKQNNSMNIYQEYFTDPSCSELQTSVPSYQTVAMTSDPRDPTRQVQHISWSPDEGTLFAVSYANTGFQMDSPNSSPNSFIFDLEDYNDPYIEIESLRPIVVLEFNHRDPYWLAGGLMNGQVAFWDIRQGSTNAAISDIRKGHRDPVNSIRWTQSKTGTEFFSGSSDSQIMWWDTRNLKEPTEILVLDLSRNEEGTEPEWTNWARSHGVFCMDYSPSIPIRFMIGTENGLVFNGNRKGKTVFEKISATFLCHYSPVYSVQRNPAFLKNFLTVGDYQVRIWSEDVKESPIIWTKYHDIKLTDGAWSKSKPSVFFTTRSDGYVDAWDLLQKQNEPILSIKVSDKGLNCIRCHEDGALLAVGDDCGKTYVIKMDDWLVVPDKNDKALLTELFDRETRREKIIEAKQRELKLKIKTLANAEVLAKQDKHAKLINDENRLIHEMENDFKKLIDSLNKNSKTKKDNTNLLDNNEDVEEEEIDNIVDQKA